MFLLISRLTRLLGSRLQGWRLPLAVIVLVFLSSWLAMALVEPADSEIAGPGNYWWYFVVTAATVGYGDFFPQSGAGRLVGTYVIVGGIVTLTLLFTRLADYLQSDERTHVMLGTDWIRELTKDDPEHRDELVSWGEDAVAKMDAFWARESGKPTARQDREHVQFTFLKAKKSKEEASQGAVVGS